ncbi:Coproporphyrinogen-III oxidase, aerobic [Waddlia chondrophila 2032/99]|uniref:coproporphyrinogen oxidase n=1 Tax=Waddlia chondrophila 2032/99 TaxID=765953 RepID=F8LFH8_9BACT|nr:Coproporphyrinogen-III oxidase, aerobic [Waddlia chondrophila 2032/99]
MICTASAHKHQEIIAFLKSLREEIIQEFESLETADRFKRTFWNYDKGSGGGEMSVLRGEVFEKAAVNWSGVSGENFPMEDSAGPFFATGVSLITHMSNPHAPTVHMNIRYIETEQGSWFGGGYDLTPMGFPYEEDTRHFHSVAQNALTPFGKELYPQFMQQAKEYFYIPHRQKERGVGGIFFDHFNSGDPHKDLQMWKMIGSTFIDSIMPIYHRRCSIPYSQEEKETQLKLRAHYVEFNLVYDRGTKFGFHSGGNPEAILCSMPPVAKW